MRFYGMITALGLSLAASWTSAADWHSEAPASAELVQALPKLCDFEMRRITSLDPTGGNRDWRELPPGQTLTLAEIDGPGCIVHFRDNITGREPHHLQYHVLRMYWDGEKTPSVEAPVGDFFGVGFGFTEKYHSAVMAIDDRRGPRNTDPAASGAARNCYLPMPFARSAKITITNEGTQPSAHWYEVNCKVFKKPPENTGYFHAQYRQGTPPLQGPYLILDAKGRGHLVGCVLSVKNNDGGWWGEGDEVVYIDGKHAIQGTGSEDYFCESYGLREGCFPYFGVTVNNDIFSTAYRWHIPDPVPFKESIRFLIEHGKGEPPFRSGNYFFSVAYWYQTEPHATLPGLPSREDRIRWTASTLKGAVEGEDMKVLAKTGGFTELQTEGRWSGSRQLWWRDGKPGDKLELAIPLARPGRYRLFVHNTRAFDYGIIQFYLDGEKLGTPIDFYSADNVTKLISLGERELAEGQHKLLVEIVGTNPAAKPRYMFGLDYVILEPVQ